MTEKELKEFEEWLREQAQRSLYLARQYNEKHPDVSERHYIRYWAFLNVIDKMKEDNLID